MLPQVPTIKGPATVSRADRVALTARASGGEQLLRVLGHHAAGVREDQVAPDRSTRATPRAASSEVRCWETAPGV